MHVSDLVKIESNPGRAIFFHKRNNDLTMLNGISYLIHKYVKAAAVIPRRRQLPIVFI